MQKIWGYLSAFLAGALLMLIVAYKFLAGDDYTVEIKKIKAKKNQGDISIPIDIDQTADEEKSKRELREEKKEKKKKNKQ